LGDGRGKLKRRGGRTGTRSVAVWAPGGQIWDWLPGSGACEIGCDRLGTNPNSHLSILVC
jgi:hypothetical protein